MSAHSTLRGQKMGTIQLAEGEAAGPGGKKSGCQLLGSCAQTVCPGHGSWLPSLAVRLELGRAPPLLTLAQSPKLLQLEINL